MSAADRPNCLNAAACAATSSGKHCKRCTMTALNRDPALNRKRQASRLANPDTVAKLRKTCVANANAWRATEQGQATLRERASQNIKLAHTPEAAAKRAAVAQRGGIRRTLTMVPGLPESGVAEFRYLTKIKRLSTEDAVRIVREQTPGTADHGRMAVANNIDAMRIKHERDLASRY